MSEVSGGCGAGRDGGLMPGSRPLVVRPTRPDEESTWRELMASHHYLGFRGLVGNSLKYVAVQDGQWVALLAWAAAAFKVGARDSWIGWTPEQQWRRLHLVVSNQRFLILPGIRVPNLASRILSMNVRRLSDDWLAVYGHPVVLVETFVDPSRFRGTCYRAAGWLVLGQTRGFGRSAGRYFHHGGPKTVLVRPLVRNAASLLSASFLAPQLSGEGKGLVDLNRVRIEGERGLLDRLAQVKDRRKRRGIRHEQVSVLAVAACACLSGARSYEAIAQWGAQLGQEELKRLRCRWDPKTGKWTSPSEPTIRRVLQAVDPDEVDDVIGQWFAEEVREGRAVALDGKALCGSTGITGKQVHLVAAVVHKTGVVVGQSAVDDKSNEITAFQPTLDPVDLKGAVVTADAMHTQVEHAKYLKETKGADFVFIAKENQPGLLQAIKDLDEDAFSPSVR